MIWMAFISIFHIVTNSRMPNVSTLFRLYVFPYTSFIYWSLYGHIGGMHAIVCVKYCICECIKGISHNDWQTKMPTSAEELVQLSQFYASTRI